MGILFSSAEEEAVPPPEAKKSEDASLTLPAAACLHGMSTTPDAAPQAAPCGDTKEFHGARETGTEALAVQDAAVTTTTGFHGVRRTEDAVATTQLARSFHRGFHKPHLLRAAHWQASTTLPMLDAEWFAPSPALRGEAAIVAATLPPPPAALTCYRLHLLHASKEYAACGHRSGWFRVMQTLERVAASASGDTTLTVVDFAERDEGFWEAGAARMRRAPHVVFLHNPVDMPAWFDGEYSTRHLIQCDAFREALPFMRLIVVFSRGLAAWLRAALHAATPTAPLPHIVALRHPIDPPTRHFHFGRFLANPIKAVVQVGYWQRRMCTIGELELAGRPAPGSTSPYRKVWLAGSEHAFDCRAAEMTAHAKEGVHGAPGTPCPSFEDVIVARVSTDGYDALLADNIVVLHLYGSVVNNTVLECILAGTPLLVNRLPAIVELLGEAYPLYADTAADRTRLLYDYAALRAGHLHLVGLNLDGALSHRAFAADFVQALHDADAHYHRTHPKAGAS